MVSPELCVVLIAASSLSPVRFEPRNRAPLLTVTGIPVAGGVGLFAAYVRAAFRAAVPAHSFLVVDPARDVEPDDLILRAMRLGRRLGGEERTRRARDCRRCEARKRRLSERRGDEK